MTRPVLAWQRGGRQGGPAVVLVHAWGSDAVADWDATGWVQALTQAGCDVLLCDLPGHGDSADVTIPHGAEPGRATAELVLADLTAQRVETAAVVGYTDGGITTGHLAVRAPERITRAALVACDDSAGIGSGRQLGAGLRDLSASVWDPEVATRVARARRDRRHHLPTLADFAERLAWPAAPRLGALRTPVLLAVGAEDPRRPRVPRLASLFHDAHLLTVPGDRASAMAAPALHDAVTRFLRA